MVNGSARSRRTGTAAGACRLGADGCAAWASYTYQSLEHMDEVASGEIGDQIRAEIVQKADIRPLT